MKAELVKHWKLHRQRNFWRENTTKDDLVHVLEMHVQHLREQERRRAKFRAEMDKTEGAGPLSARSDEGARAPGSPQTHGAEGGADGMADLDTSLLRMRVALPLLVSPRSSGAPAPAASALEAAAALALLRCSQRLALVKSFLA